MSPRRILALDPSTKGFGFIVLEEGRRLIDWGLKEAAQNRSERSLRQAVNLMKLYEPHLLVIEDASSPSRRCERVRALLRDLREEARRRRVRVARVTKRELRKAFEPHGATAKYEIARLMAERFPEVADRLPPPRRPWDGSDPRMALFQSLAMAVAVTERA